MRGAGARANGGQEEQASPVERAADPAGVGAEFFDDLLREIVQDSLLSGKSKGMAKCPRGGTG